MSNPLQKGGMPTNTPLGQKEAQDLKHKQEQARSWTTGIPFDESNVVQIDANGNKVQQTKPVQSGRTNLTFDDFLRESGGDPVKAREWLKAHPGYVVGDKTNAWLEANPIPEAEAKVETGDKTEEAPIATPETKEELVEAVKEADSPNEAADKVAKAVGAGNEQKEQIKQATKSIWSALADGTLSPESGSYFLLDAIQKAANNRQRRDSNYIENLSRAAHGDTILGYDVSNDEKSKYETMVQDPALERANKAAGIESEKAATTASDLTALDTKTEYGNTVTPQEMGKAAAVQNATEGNVTPETVAIGYGDENKVQNAINASLDKPALETEKVKQEIVQTNTEMINNIDQAINNIDQLIYSLSTPNAGYDTYTKAMEAYIGSIQGIQQTIGSSSSGTENSQDVSGKVGTSGISKKFVDAGINGGAQWAQNAQNTYSTTRDVLASDALKTAQDEAEKGRKVEGEAATELINKLKEQREQLVEQREFYAQYQGRLSERIM